MQPKTVNEKKAVKQQSWDVNYFIFYLFEKLMIYINPFPIYILIPILFYVDNTIIILDINYSNHCYNLHFCFLVQFYHNSVAAYCIGE